jgi:triosephosphate isomerase
MNPKNAQEILSQKDVDGGLIGGASLNIDSFSSLVQIAENVQKEKKQE